METGVDIATDCQPITVLIADDHALARDAVRTILAADRTFVVVGEATTAEEAFAAAKRLRPRLVLMDIRMPGDGIKATRRIKAVFPDIRVVMITVSDEAQHLFEALRAGAQGYLLKNLAPEQWTGYLRDVMDGDAPLSGTLARRILTEMTGGGSTASAFVETRTWAVAQRSASAPLLVEPLTPRETDVLQLVAQGLTNREIAERLTISENTVKNHLKNILGKVQVDNRTQLVRYALERGLIAPDGLAGYGPFGSSAPLRDDV